MQYRNVYVDNQCILPIVVVLGCFSGHFLEKDGNNLELKEVRQIKSTVKRKGMILQFVVTGNPVAEISFECGIAESTIYKWKRNNIPVVDSSLTQAQIKRVQNGCLSSASIFVTVKNTALSRLFKARIEERTILLNQFFSRPVSIKNGLVILHLSRPQKTAGPNEFCDLSLFEEDY